MTNINAKCKVFYDGSCPLCRREINLYTKLDKDKQIEWLDVSSPDTFIPQNVTREYLLSRIHLIGSDGQLQVGAAAFFFIWKKLPGWRWLGDLGSNRFVFRSAELFYEIFLKIRPFIQIPFKILDRMFGKS
jgi:predicted DCC family thiol-disulfide oxidoreductase YuxK